jgi:methylenetetrahydrofolate dehydrogenase (NADP+)/methenyltetrahydrofolate cyclohydrolase
MTASLIDGKAIAQQVRDEIRDEIDAWMKSGGRRPGLATVLVGEDPASAVYVGGKQKACVEVGIEGFAHDLPADASQDEVIALLHELNADDRVSGILLQLPTPDHIDGSHLTTLIDPGKDVDGLTPVSAGLLAKGLPGLRPCTPAGCIELLRRHDVPLQGAEAVVVGRSDLVGKPVAALLLAENATVTMCHSRTRDLPEVCRRADVLVAAVGRPEMVLGDWIKPGAVVIDVGMTRLTPEEAGNTSGLVGDVDFAGAVEVASAITPVPGGVGPMTIALLLRNTLQAARRQAGIDA